MSPVPLLDLRAQYAAIRGKCREAMDRVVEAQALVLGPEVAAFERECGAYCGAKHAVGCSSGTDALLMALMACGVGHGDEVVTSAFSFFATAGSIRRLGARPVFADIEPMSFNIASGDIEDRITPRTRAMIPVHLYGQCADMTPILEVARRYGVPVVEDAAQAIGAETGGKRAGGLGEIGCFSFYPTKNLGAFGDAGMVTTNDDALAEKLRMIRVHGSARRYYHDIVGGNFRLDAIQAAVLRVKLQYLDSWTEARQRHAAAYNAMFEEANAALPPERAHDLLRMAQSGEPADWMRRLILPAECPGGGAQALRGASNPFPGHRHVYNQYVIRTDRRAAVMTELEKSGIGHMIYYPLTLPEQACFQDLGYKHGDFPVAECAAATALALPIYPELTEAQIREVVDAVVRGLRND